MISDEEHVARNKTNRHKQGRVKEADPNSTQSIRMKAARKKWREENPKYYRFLQKKNSANALGIPFELVFEDIKFPVKCPVLGIELDYSLGKGRESPRLSTPSFDRIDPSKGYVIGNVLIVSMRANSIKSDATPDEILTVGKYYKTLIS